MLTHEQANNVLASIHAQAILPDLYNDIVAITLSVEHDQYLVAVSHDSKPCIEELHMTFDWAATNAPYALEAKWIPLLNYTKEVYPGIL